MRDFRDAKAMAHTLRAALAARGLKITISQSLELIAEAFGVADWNTLAAAIRAEPLAPRQSASPLPPASSEIAQRARFPAEFQSTLTRAFAFANKRKHEYTTLEHLLLALIDDADAAAVMKGCNVDLGALKDDLAGYVDNELKRLEIGDGSNSKPTVAFQRVVQRAELQVHGLGRDTVTGAQVLLAIFAERESPAAWFLGEQDVTHQEVANFIAHGIGKGSGDAVS
jgi:Glyoxalase superfamily protein/Clp amino terminal domain, pathogenicity island component